VLVLVVMTGCSYLVIVGWALPGAAPFRWVGGLAGDAELAA
jgi:hypothetical protein